jgi:hypothetical protein
MACGCLSAACSKLPHRQNRFNELTPSHVIPLEGGDQGRQLCLLKLHGRMENRRAILWDVAFCIEKPARVEPPLNDSPSRNTKNDNAVRRA